MARQGGWWPNHKTKMHNYVVFRWQYSRFWVVLNSKSWCHWLAHTVNLQLARPTFLRQASWYCSLLNVTVPFAQSWRCQCVCLTCVRISSQNVCETSDTLRGKIGRWCSDESHLQNRHWSEMSDLRLNPRCLSIVYCIETFREHEFSGNTFKARLCLFCVIKTVIETSKFKLL